MLEFDTTRPGGMRAVKEGDNVTIEQDLNPYIEAAKRNKLEFENKNIDTKSSNMRKFATIPDWVALEIYSKYKLNIHDPAFSDNPNNWKRFKQIMIMEYSALVENT